MAIVSGGLASFAIRMNEKESEQKKPLSADWFARGILTKLGDSLDRWTGRQWMPSSSLATSELIERIKRLLDDEAKEVPGKRLVVPHNIKLKMQWDKFSGDAEGSLETLRDELLIAAVDHINDSLYYTFAPVSLEIRPDYFTDGVKLNVSFDMFADEDDVEQNVALPNAEVSETVADVADENVGVHETCYLTRYTIAGSARTATLCFPAGQRRSVGRADTNDLALDDASVSKLHASLAADEAGSLSVADTGSTNGTFINEERIAYGKAIRLNPGDRVKFGVIEVSFEPIAKPATVKDENIGES